MSNLTEHKCAGKCPEFDGEQCNHCLIAQVEKREFELGVAPDDAYVKTISVEATTCSNFVKGDTVVFVDAFMPDHLMTVHKVQGDGILLDDNRKFALAHLLRHANTHELSNKKRHITTFDEAFGELS
ncbi:hypothetical protein HYG93_07285 [Acinetobacter sp. SwsAc6]|uniref:hypothetical protein n=1 Tax=Acinetobacter sp. SwsAc6 TaxID=2749439 RepID=UPI0015B8FEB7|nr:hypothetical protein [Acinetobacter sp. SwsAc6]NWK74091.1 hypothetical protein [Acinetobacter sp. SwsAc6]